MMKRWMRGTLVHRLVQAAVNRWSVVRFHDVPLLCGGGGMADTKVLKTFARRSVRVRIPLAAP